MPIETQQVNIDEVSGLRQHLTLLGRLAQNRTSGSNLVVTPFGNIPLEDITAVTDTLGNANYTFVIIPSIHSTNKFFNLVVHQAPDEDEFSSFVMEYELEANYAEDYFNGAADLSDFHGSMRSYSPEEFLSLTGNEENRACGEDTGNSSEPCNESDVDNSDGPASNDGSGQDGSGEGDSDNGDPIGNDGPGDTGPSDGGGSNGSSRPCWATLYIVNCGGSNSAVGHPLSTCQGPQNLPNEEVYFVNTCGVGGIQRTASRPDMGCPIGGGAAGISPVPFADLGMALGLSSEENSCLSSVSNCDLKNDIYSFLNANILPDGSNWEQDALDFAGLVLDELVDDCEWDFEVDFEELIIISENFENNQRLKCVYDKFKAGDNTISNYLENFLGERPVAHLKLSSDNNFQQNNPDNPDVGAKTVEPQNYIIEIVFNTDSDSDGSAQNFPTIVVASDLIHEMLHAEMYRKLLSVAQEPEIPWSEEFINNHKNDFPTLVEYYVRWKYGNPTQPAATAQHQLMADYYRGMIIEALKDFDNNEHSDSFYEMLSWSGLIGTVAWNSLNSTQQTNYTNQFNTTVQNETHQCTN